LAAVEKRRAADDYHDRTAVTQILDTTVRMAPLEPDETDLESFVAARSRKFGGAVRVTNRRLIFGDMAVGRFSHLAEHDEGPFAIPWSEIASARVTRYAHLLRPPRIGIDLKDGRNIKLAILHGRLSTNWDRRNNAAADEFVTLVNRCLAARETADNTQSVSGPWWKRFGRVLRRFRQ
jgi:hypothetical protein